MADKAMTIGQLENAMTELMSQTDRGAAIIGACLLDEMLRELLIGAMSNGTRSVLNNKLFDGPQKPLSSFSSKITIGHTLGVIDKADSKALEHIRKIRNQFAHALETLTFKSEEIKPLCMNLRDYMNSLEDVYSDAVVSENHNDEERAAFMHAVSHVGLSILNNGYAVSGEIPRAVKQAKIKANYGAQDT